jgi:hypothetical protein
MYKSPIETFQTGIEYQFENDIMNMIQKYGITVDKDELLKALRYDRDQYDKGYVDGKRAANDEIVRCKDCKWWYDRHIDPITNYHYGCCERPLGEYYECDCDFCTTSNDFCSYAERKEENE